MGGATDSDTASGGADGGLVESTVKVRLQKPLGIVLEVTLALTRTPALTLTLALALALTLTLTAGEHAPRLERATQPVQALGWGQG